ncbi:NAD-dependent epimerase/dehydratase family protein [Aurantimonas sp. E1-2-R+4]|uniref:NAD-dependent epimerase/dehydratase family protein n=1 Tax=Aurantimonas sp. E1-2-R+4 TaxID=3113714 RepID=UPI003FA52540
MVKTFAVTGARGFIGREVVRQLAARGDDVVALARSAIDTREATWRKYDLTESLPDGLLADVDAIIHLAAETDRGPFMRSHIELDALRSILAGARPGVRVVFVSSQAASPHAPTDYGRTKWLCEKEAIERGAVVVRPGLVIGSKPGGLFAVLDDVARRSPIVPRFIPSPLIYPINVADLATGLIAAADEGRNGECYHIASAYPVPFHRFMSEVALRRHGRRPLKLPIPSALITLADKLAELAGVRIAPLRRLRSLFDLPPLHARDDMRNLALAEVDWRQRLDLSSKGMRVRSREAAAILRYIVGRSPPGDMVRRYVRLLRTDARARSPLGFALLERLFPPTLWFRDVMGVDPAFERQLDAAMSIAESAPVTVYRFLRVQGETNLASLLMIAVRTTAEVPFVIVGIVRKRLARGHV